MLVTELGMVMLLSEAQSSNAKSPILVTESGITTLLSLPVYFTSTPFLILNSLNRLLNNPIFFPSFAVDI